MAAKKKTASVDAKSRNETKHLKAELKTLQAESKKKVDALNKEWASRFDEACACAYEQGFNNALDELERFTTARDKHLMSAEKKFEAEYASKLKQSSKKGKASKAKAPAKKAVKAKSTKSKAVKAKPSKARKAKSATAEASA